MSYVHSTDLKQSVSETKKKKKKSLKQIQVEWSWQQRTTQQQIPISIALPRATRSILFEIEIDADVICANYKLHAHHCASRVDTENGFKVETGIEYQHSTW